MQYLGRFLVVWMLLAGSLACSAWGREIYVDNVAGNDRFSGHQSQNSSDQAGPVRTIAKALQLAHNGDRIIVAKTDQPYRESISLVGSRHSGSAHRPFTIEGNGAILDGSAPIRPDQWEHYGGIIFRFRPPSGVHQQLFLDDRPVTRMDPERLFQPQQKIEPLQWCLHGGYAYFCVEPNKLPADYKLTHACTQTGITLFHVRHVGIVDLIVQGYQLDGLNLHNSARGVYLGGVTARGNGRAGVAVGGASQVELDVCTLGNNGQAQLLTLPLSETSVRNTELFSDTAPGWLDRGGRVYIDGKQVEGGSDGLEEKETP